MDKLQFDFNEPNKPLYVIATKIPRPLLKEGVHQKLDGLTTKNTILILANEQNLLKYITVEMLNEPLEVRQLIGGISIISRETLIATLKDLKNWHNQTDLQNVTFYDSNDDATQVLQKLSDAQNRYFSGLLEETKPHVKPLELEVINFSNYILQQIGDYGNGHTMEQLVNYKPEKEEIIPNTKSKFSNLNKFKSFKFSNLFKFKKK